MKELENVVIVGGAGHVGLPLGLVLAKKGLNVKAFDIDSKKVELVNSGQMPFMENGASELLKDCLIKQTFRATTKPDCVREAKYIIVVVGTPVDEHLSPNPNAVVSAVMQLSSYLRDDQVLILRSTLFPGVMKRLENFLSDSNLKLFLAYCPERIVEGDAIREILTLPQIVGARDERQYEVARVLFDAIGVETIHVSPEEAELAKLFTNVWRYIKFAAANQFWMMSCEVGVDYEKVRKAISHNYPRAQDLPKSGFTAGPCLFKDTMQLSALVQQGFPLGHAAMMINEGTPGYLVKRLKDKFNLSELNVGILGVAFKGNVDDIRSSLAFKLRKLLLFEAKQVLMCDPYVQDERLVNELDVVNFSDILIIGAPHDLYATLKSDKIIVDIWSLTGRGVSI